MLFAAAAKVICARVSSPYMSSRAFNRSPYGHIHSTAQCQIEAWGLLGLFANANKQQHIMCNDKTKYTSESLIPIDFVMDQRQRWTRTHQWDMGRPKCLQIVWLIFGIVSIWIEICMVSIKIDNSIDHCYDRQLIDIRCSEFGGCHSSKMMNDREIHNVKREEGGGRKEWGKKYRGPRRGATCNGWTFL